MIRTIIFDLGGVILTLDQPQAVRRFAEIGLKDAARRLDPYTQSGIFGALEAGATTAGAFRNQLSQLVGRQLSFRQCRYAWLGYARELPARNLRALERLRSEGYRLVLLSNTNPYMMSWVFSTDFDGEGHSLHHYMDACYTSYEMGVMKPNDTFFRKVLMAEQTPPSACLFVDDGPRNVAAASQIGMRTFCPENGADWTQEIYQYL